MARRLPPHKIAEAEVEKGTITKSAYARLREKLDLRECTWTWAEDIWFGKDVDCRGNFTGHGTGKVKCRACARTVPLIYMLDIAAAWWAIKQRHGIHGPPPPPELHCADCRIKPPPDRNPKHGDDQTTRYAEYLGFDRNVGEGGEHMMQEWGYAPADEVVDDELCADSSPLGDVLVDMSGENEQLFEDSLPAEDDETLQKAIAAFTQTGELHDFLNAAGDVAAAKIQRERYQTTREILI
jgi:hypothetical protein